MIHHTLPAPRSDVFAHEPELLSRQLLALNAIAAAAIEATSFEAALQVAVDELCRHMECDVGHAFVRREETPPVLVSAHVWHIAADERFAAFRRQTTEVRSVRGDGLAGAIWRVGEPLWIRDVTVHREFSRARTAADAGLRAAFGFPIVSRGEVVSVLEFFYDEIREPESRLVEIAAQVGALLGRVFERQEHDTQLDALNHDLERRVVQRTAELNENRAELQDFLDSATDLIQSVTPDGRYRFVNRAWCETLGYTSAEAAALSIFDVIAPEHHEHCRAAFRDLMAAPAPLRIETTFRTKDGRDVQVEGHINVRSEDGQPAVTRGMFRDITERKRAEQQLIENLAREKQLNELKARFVSVASHELRTPLAALTLGLDYLGRYWAKLSPEQVTKNLAALDGGVHQLRRILDDVLLIGQSEEGRMVCRPTAINLAEFCHKLVAEVSAADHERHLIEWSCPNDGACPEAAATAEVEVDPHLLRHVVVNLLGNACKYSPEGKPVRLAVSREAGRLVLAIIDKGIGIPETDQPRLFDFFFRASNVGQIAGTGLGLMVVRRCVEAHGGSVTFQSAPGRGTTFTVSIPLPETAPTA